MKLMYLIRLMSLIMCVFLAGCPIVRATGDAVDATGEGIGHAVEGTGNAIGRAGHELAP